MSRLVAARFATLAAAACLFAFAAAPKERVTALAPGTWVLEEVLPSQGMFPPDPVTRNSAGGAPCVVEGGATSTATSGRTWAKGGCPHPEMERVDETTTHSWTRPPEKIPAGATVKMTASTAQSGHCSTLKAAPGQCAEGARTWLEGRVDGRGFYGSPYVTAKSGSGAWEWQAPTSGRKMSLKVQVRGSWWWIFTEFVYTWQAGDDASGGGGRAAPGSSSSNSPSGGDDDGGGSNRDDSDDSDEGGGISGGDAGGGLLSVIAIVISLVSVLRTPPAKDAAEEKDATKPVGYALELSTRQIELAPGRTAIVAATVYEVYRDGRTEVARNASISFGPPAGVDVTPGSGGASVAVTATLTGGVETGAVITVSAETPGGSYAETVAVAVAETPGRLEARFEPPEKSTLATFGGDSVTIVGRIAYAEGATIDPAESEAARASIDFSSGSEWLDLSAVVDWGDDGRAVRAMASQPDPNHPSQPPETVSLTCTATIAGAVQSQTLTIALARNPSIDAAPDTVHFVVDSGETVEVRAWIEDDAGLAWSFRTEWRDGSSPLATVQTTDEQPASVMLELTEAAAEYLDPAIPEQAATLRIIAAAPGCEDLERYVRVIVSQEGLFIDPTGRDEDGSYQVLADGSVVPKEIDFRVFTLDAEGRIQLQTALAESLQFEHIASEGSRSRNAAEVGNLEWAPGETRASSSPSTPWRFTVEYQIPADTPVVRVPLRVAVPGLDAEKFEKTLVLGLRASRFAPGGPDWERELNRCKAIIFDFVPDAHQPKMMDILNRRSRALGADGLAEMRHQIWKIAQNLTLGVGGEGYRAEGNWAGRIETVLGYAEWAGDVAFHGATAHFIGPYYAFGAATLKGLVISAIRAYDEGRTPIEWAWENAGSLPANLAAIGEGQVIDVDKFAKLTGDDRMKAWALFVSYHFFKAYFYNGRTFTEALWEAGAQARDEAIAAWIGAELRKGAAPARPEVQRPREAAPGARAPEPVNVARPGPNARKQKAPVTPAERAPEFEAPTARERADKMAEAVKAKTRPGPRGPEIDVETMEKIMRDPDAARELKKNPEAWKAYDNARQQVYDKRKEQLEAWIKENVPSARGHDVEVVPVGHPDGVDLDYRAGVLRKNPVTGADEFIEIDPKHWEPKSNEIFGDLTGKPPGVSAEKWAADRQQLATSQHHSQASPDMADQGWVKDPKTGRMVRTQVEPNVNLVKHATKGGPDHRLLDPDAYGKTYETKVADSYYADAPLDAFKQAQKLTQSLEGYTDGSGRHPGIRDGYRNQGYDVPEAPPPNLKKGMDIIDDVVAGRKTPAEGDAALKEAKLGENLPGFMQQMSGHVAGFKFARK